MANYSCLATTGMEESKNGGVGFEISDHSFHCDLMPILHQCSQTMHDSTQFFMLKDIKMVDVDSFVQVKYGLISLRMMKCKRVHQVIQSESTQQCLINFQCDSFAKVDSTHPWNLNGFICNPYQYVSKSKNESMGCCDPQVLMNRMV